MMLMTPPALPSCLSVSSPGAIQALHSGDLALQVARKLLPCARAQGL
jgi:hypothetical protein